MENSIKGARALLSFKLLKVKTPRLTKLGMQTFYCKFYGQTPASFRVAILIAASKFTSTSSYWSLSWPLNDRENRTSSLLLLGNIT